MTHMYSARSNKASGFHVASGVKIQRNVRSLGRFGVCPCCVSVEQQLTLYSSRRVNDSGTR